MENFIKPENEVQRIERLKYYDILDAENEAQFDDITQLAAQILELPICQITLVDSDWQTFISNVGTDMRGNYRELSFCQYTIIQDDITEVSDATQDIRFCTNPVVAEAPKLRYYIGAPLIDDEGFAIGTLCGYDVKPRNLTNDQKTILSNLARTVMRLIQFRKVNKEQNRFFSDMSHEIKTPLSSIVGYSELLHNGSLDQQQNEYVDSINFSANLLSNVVNNVLDVYKLRNFKIVLDKTHVQIEGLITKICSVYALELKKKNIELSVSIDAQIPEFITADETRLTQILGNLISNAIKFTQEGTISVKITLESSEKFERLIKFEVTDTGIGIDPEKSHLLFKQFSQLDVSTFRNYGGTGLGLSICKLLVELHEGEINWESELGKGTSIFFTIPLIETIGNTVKTTGINEEYFADLSRYSMILADDNEQLRLLGMEHLKSLNINVFEASNGLEVLEILKTNSIQLILMDIQMPVMDGIVATEKIRELYGNTIPVIGSTAGDLDEVDDHYRLIGMNDFLSKPYTRIAMFEKIYSALKINQQLDSRLMYDEFDNAIQKLKLEESEELVHELIELMKTNLPKDIRELEDALVQKNRDFIFTKTHYFISSLSTFHFTKGIDLADNILSFKTNSDQVVLVKRTTAFIHYLKELFTYLKNEQND